MRAEQAVFEALSIFAAAVKTKMTQLTTGEPEDQLRGPFETLMTEVGEALGQRVVCTGEAALPDRTGTPDYAVHSKKLLTGYVELKATGKGANPNRYTGHDRQQWNRFKAIPNLIYCDGSEWALYRSGEREGRLVRLSGDVTTDGRAAVTTEDAAGLLGLLTTFLSWTPIIPKDVKALCGLLAPLCGKLRDDVSEAVKHPDSPLVQLAKDWRQLLFPEASDEQFADAYAQTVTFALLLARAEGATTLDLGSAEGALAAEHSLLSRALQVLTDVEAQKEIAASLHLLQRVINEVPEETLKGPRDPWLYFYEDFLTAYDPKLRKDAGAYYTPPQVVRAQVRLIDELLTKRLGKPLGFAHSDVVTLDPAVGTGTYLLGVIEHALDRVAKEQGEGAVAARATELAQNLCGFEIMVGPYAVSQLRVSRALENRGATLPEGGPHVYLTDTLESPRAVPPQVPLYLRPISDQHKRALEVKGNVPVIVCLGNPPYDRHPAADESNKARTGGWVRWGEQGDGTGAILNDFLQSALDAGHGGDVKNLYNLYIYFWRWALWKVFEHESARGPGVVSFISASSYLDGDAFVGVREHLRRVCDEVWILDLGGEGRGTRQSENVFNIKTPVAIAVAARYGNPDAETPATVHLARIEGTRDEKLGALKDLKTFADIGWESCPDDWQAPFRPAGTGAYFELPLLTELFPWQHSGVQLKRTWPIAPDTSTLARRWRGLLTATDRSAAFRGTGDREVGGTYHAQLTDSADTTPIAKLPGDAPVPPLVPYGYRSFDRHWVIADGRLMSRPRADLWGAHGERQVYLTTLLNHPLGRGPALTAAGHIPDLHHFRGSYGAKEVVPLYREAAGMDANILPGLLDLLAQAYRRTVTPEDFLAYVYGVLAQPAFTERFEEELGTRELRVPVTKDAALFDEVFAVGRKLLWLHTYGERFVPEGEQKGRVPPGRARCTKAVPDDPRAYPEDFAYNAATGTLRVGQGTFEPVAPALYEFEVSGLKVVQSWLKYRMKAGAGRKSSPLDDIRPERWTAGFTTGLLELLWVLEATVEQYPAQSKLLERVLEGPLFTEEELPGVPDYMRKPPSRPGLLA